MTGTSLPRKRSERGASLIMLVSIIGLAFIVTVAGFLVAASDSQDIARLASAKVDVATREDALMREILQQTATGMLPGTGASTGPALTWTQIMTNAATVLSATSYVDPAELAALPGLAGVIPANMGDTAGTLLGIFQGYQNSEVPFGGTTGVANLVPVIPALAAVEPPLMNWPGPALNATLSATTGVNIPQEFFLGSYYTAVALPVPTFLSASKRWGQILYPNIRFGYKQPGDSFIARRVWWRIPLVYQATQQNVEVQVGATPVYRYPSATANYVLSVYEIPSQLPISGNGNLRIGNNTDGTTWGTGVTISGTPVSGSTPGPGSIYGSQIQLAGGSYKGIGSRQQVNVLGPATVGGTPYSNSAFDAVGTRETLALTTTPGAAPVSVAGNDGKVLVVPVMPGNQFYMSVPTTPTHWDLYARPYYRCRIRIIITGTNSTLIYNPNVSPQMSAVANAGAITVSVNFLPDSLSQPDQILGFLDSAASPATNSPYTQTSYANPPTTWPSWLTYTSTGNTPTTAARNILLINVGAMVTALGSPAQLYSIYIGSNPAVEPATPPSPLPPPYAEPGIAITGASDLSAFSNGLSIVSNQTLYLLDAFNQVNVTGGTLPPPTSIFAPDVRYGISGTTPASTTIIGQVSVDQASPLIQASPSPTPGNPLQFLDASGNKISTSTNTFTLGEIAAPAQMPPITRLTLLFTIERERTN